MPLYKSKEGPKFAGEAATSLVEWNMRSTFRGLAFLFAGSLLTSSASAGNSGHFGGFRFSPSFHHGAFGHHVGDTGPGHSEFRRDYCVRSMGFHDWRAGEQPFGFHRWHNGGYALGLHRWYNGSGDYFGFSPGIFYVGPTTANETAAAPIIVIPTPVYVPVAPAQRVVSSGPQIIEIGTQKTGPLPRVVYGIPPEYPSM